MAHIHIPEDVPVRRLPRSKTAMVVFGLMAVVGAAAFLFVLGRDAERAWQAYVANWLFFTSIAMGAVILTAATTIVKARWNWSVRRVSLAFVSFLPVSFLLLLPMLLGVREEYFHWMVEMAEDPILQAKAAYLNIPFLVTRNLVGALVLFGLSGAFAWLALRPDMGLAREAGDEDAGRGRWRERLTRDWVGQELEEVRSYQRMKRMAPAMVLLYAVVMSVFAFDWAMSLEPHWFSTIFGAWFFMGAFWGGIAATALTVVLLKRRDPELDRVMGSQQLHDLGKLLFAFCVFWAYLFWSQYLVIWYGKLPWEQAWVVHRAEEPWGKVSLLVVVLCFVLPFAGLLGRRPKMIPAWLGSFAALILAGLWLERYMLIAPSLNVGEGPVFPLWELLVGIGFLGLFLASVRWFLSTFPIVQLWQPLVEPELLEAEGEVGAARRRAEAGT